MEEEEQEHITKICQECGEDEGVFYMDLDTGDFLCADCYFDN